MSSARQIRLSSSSKRTRVSASRRFPSSSSETVTFVSDVETRSIDSPQRSKAANAFARKPTSCHMPTVSIDTSTMLFLQEMAFSCTGPSGAPPWMTVPSMSGKAVLKTRMGMARSRSARMQRGWRTLLPVAATSWASR